MVNMMDEKTIQNAQRVAYLVREYPKQKMVEMIGLLVMPEIDKNTAIWAAAELGYIALPDEQTGFSEFKKAPDVWYFGEHELHLESTILYCVKKRAEKEFDIEEFFLTQWCAGYPAHDVLIATKHLMEMRKITSYDIVDKTDKKAPSTYTFFTLYKNAEHRWGRKSFKKDPEAKE